MSGSKQFKTKFQHIVIFLGIFGSVAYLFQTQFLNSALLGFIESQFKPEGQVMMMFDGVSATPTRIGEQQHAAGGTVDLKKDYINKEFVFDFTGAVRTDEEHGYQKHSGEWYVKAPALGEHAIMLEKNYFFILSMIVASLVAFLITTILPDKLGYVAIKIEREIYNTKAKVRLQTGFSAEIVDILTARDNDLEKLAESRPDTIREAFKTIWNRTMPEKSTGGQQTKFEEMYEPSKDDAVTFRNQILYGRMKEYYSEFVVNELEDVKNALAWRRNHFKIFKGLRLYMAHHFSHKYSNSVTGFAYGGAAFLIIAVGIRGLKFIPASRPSLIFFAILMEFAMLSLLAITLFYTEGEERMDKMLKKMEDASRSQLDSLNKVATDMHQLRVTFEGGTSEMMKRKVEEAVAEYLQSQNNVESAVATAIRDKIIVSLRETFAASK